MVKEEGCLEKLKKDYKKIQVKYNLPEFEKLNEDFAIERAAEVETDFLLREIRKYISDKLYNYLRFLESVLNPVTSPMFIFSIIKTLGKDEKTKLSEVYKKLAKIEVVLFEIDVQFSEEKEANFIKDTFKLWQEIKKDLLDVVEVINKKWDNKSEVNGRGYFG